jgi:hypothetical protein
MAGTLRAAIAAVLMIPAVAFGGSSAPPRVTLTLQVIGPGAVTATPGGRCAGYLTRVHVCRTSYGKGAHVRLAAVPTASGKLSSWRGAAVGSALTRTVTMNTAKLVTATFVKRPPPPPPAPPPAPAVGTRSNPVPLGAPVDVTTFNNEHWRFRIVSTQPDATAAVMAENQFNDPPAAGNQFFIATLEVTYISGAAAENADIVADDVRAVGPSNVVYSTFGSTSRCGVIPDGFLFKGDLLAGGSITGNICWQVPTAEVGTLIAFIELNNTPYYLALR